VITETGTQTPGRFGRTVVLGVLAPGVGSGLFDHPDDPLLAAVPFVLVILGTSALTSELTRQAQRGRAGWARSDTAITGTLLVIAALLTLSYLFADTPGNESTSAACFAVLYLVLAGYFGYVRRKTVRQATA
jgi:hypothetical protein